MDVNEETVSADLGTAPEQAFFKSPESPERRDKKKKIRTFKEIALAQETDTFIKEKK